MSNPVSAQMTRMATEFLVVGFEVHNNPTPRDLAKIMLDVAMGRSQQKEARGLCLLLLEALIDISLENTDKELFIEKMTARIPAVSDRFFQLAMGKGAA